MKRTRKQLLALFLAFAMAFSLLPAPALAAGEEGTSENAFDGVPTYEEALTAVDITEAGTYMIWVTCNSPHWMHNGTDAVNGCGGDPGSAHTRTEAHTTGDFNPETHEWEIAPVTGGFTLKSVDMGGYVTVTPPAAADAATTTLGLSTDADAAAVFAIAPGEGYNYTFQWTSEANTVYYLYWNSGFALKNETAFTETETVSTVRLFRKTYNTALKEIPGYTRVATAEDLVDGSYLVIAPANDGNFYVLRPAAWGSGTDVTLATATYQLTLNGNHVVTEVSGADTNATLADMHYTISGGDSTTAWKITHGDSLSFYPKGSGHNLWHTTVPACTSHAGTPIAHTNVNGGSFRIAAGGVYLLLNGSGNTFGGSGTISGHVIDFLFFKVDKTALAAAIEEAEPRTEDDYTTTSWTAFSTALGNANTVNNDIAATPADVTEAVDALQAAINGLVNISALKTAIEQAENLCNTGSGTYTTESLGVLSDALDSARETYLNTAADQTAVDGAVTALQNAINGLEFISAPTSLTIPGYTAVTEMPSDGLTDGYYLIVVAHDDGNGAKSYYALYPGGTGSDPANARKMVVSDNLLATGLCDSSGDAAAPVAFANAHNHISRVPSGAEDVVGIQYYITAITAPDVMAEGALRTVYEFAIDTAHELYHVRATVCPGDYVAITKDGGEDTFSFRGHTGQYFGLNSSGPKFGCGTSASGLECGVMLFRYTGVEKTYLLREVNFITAANPQEERYTAATWEALQTALTAANEVLNDDNAAQADVDAALDDLTTAWTNLAVHDPHALPGYTHKTDTDFSPTKRYLVVSWSSADKPHALYFDSHNIGAGALLTTNVETATSNVAPITLTGADETLVMTFDKGSEEDVQLSILSDGHEKYYVKNGDKYFSLGDHVYEEAATTVGITKKADNSFLLSGTPSSGSDRYLSLNVHGDAACSKNNWKNLATGFWGPTDAAVVEFPVFIYESEADFGAAALPTGAAISAQMLNSDQDNTWVFTGGRATEGAYEDIALSRTAVSAFEEYIRWTLGKSSVTTRQRYVFNLGYTGQTLENIVSSFEARIKPLQPKAVVYAVGPEDVTAYASDIETFKTSLGSFIDKTLAVRNTSNTTEDTYAIIVKPYRTATNGSDVDAIDAAIEAVVAEKAADEATAAKIQVVASTDFSTDGGTYLNSEGYPTAKGQLNLSYRFAQAVVKYTGAENNYPYTRDYGGLYTTNWPGELVTGTAEEVTLDPAYAAARTALKEKVDNKNAPMTWLFMGDSITHGALWSEGQDTISQLFDKFVKKDLGRKQDIVLNTAVSSADSGTGAEGTMKYINDRLNKYDPDVVTIMIGTNDAAVKSGSPVVSVEDYKTNLTNILNAIFAKGAIAVLRTPIPDGAGNRGEHIYKYVAAMKEVVNGLTDEQKKKVILVDQFAEWAPYLMTADNGIGTTFLFGKVFTEDGNKVHPGPVGHLWMTQELIRDMGLWDTNSTICKLHYHDTDADWGITEATSTQAWEDYVKYNASSHILTVPVSVFNNGGTAVSVTVTATVGGQTYTGTALRGGDVTIDLSEAVTADANAAQNVTLNAAALVSVSASAGQKVTFPSLANLDLTSGPAIPEVTPPPQGATLYAGGDEQLLPPNHNEVTTNGQPYNAKTQDRVGVAGSRHFRIPALITLKHQKNEELNGRLVAAMDARWTHTADAYNIDTLVAYSDDSETWYHNYANYFADSIYVDNSTTLMDPRRATVFIDPVLAEGLDGTIYLMADLFPGGVATLGDYGVTPAMDTGYRDIELNGVTKKRMILYTMTDGAYTDTTRDPNVRPQTADNWTFFIGDFEGPEGGDKYAAIYNNRCNPTELYVDEYYYLYKKASVEAERDPENDRIYCPQILNRTNNNTTGWASNSEDSYIQQNVFFYNSILHVRCASYLWVVKSTDGGETWSKPTILNDQVRKDPAEDQFYGVGPGAGLTLEYGPLEGMVLLPTYIHGGAVGEIAEFIYTRDNGKTWGRSQRTTKHGANTGGESSESCLVQIGDTTVRHFYRDLTSLLNYTDHEWDGTKWVAGEQHTVYESGGAAVSRATRTQVSAIKYSKQIDGKDAILYSTATGPSNNRRVHGCIFVLLMEDDGTMTKAYTYEVNGVNDGYAYSSLSEMEDGAIALLYENSGQTLNSCNPFVIIPIEDIADGAMLSDGTTVTQRLSVPLYDTFTEALSEEGRAAMQTQLASSTTVSCTVNSADGTVTLLGRAPGSETVTYTTRDNQTVTITVVVEGTGNTQEVAMTLPDHARKVVTGLPAGALVGDNSDPDVASAEMEQHNETVSITDGARAKRFGTNAYNGDTVDLVDCLYTFTGTGTANQYYIQNIKYPALFLNLATAAKRPNGAKEAIKIADGADSKITISATVNDGTTYLYFGVTSGNTNPHFDRNGGNPAASNYFYLYRPAGEGDTASAEIPGFVKLDSISEIESGKQYLIVSKIDNAYYVLYPSAAANDFASGALVNAADKSDQSHTWGIDSTLTITGKAAGTTVVMACGTRYNVTVIDGRQVVGGVSVTGTAQVGQTLTADVTLSDEGEVDDAKVTYTWYTVDNGTETAITSATGSTYVPVADDEGKQIKVVVTAKAGEGYMGSATSALTAPVAAAGAVVTNHAITVDTTPQNGTIAVSADSAAPGAQIIITFTPSEGYKVAKDSLKVYKTGDETVTVTVTDDHFAMPDHDVTVTAQFEPLTDLSDAQAAVESATYTAAQASCANKAAAEAAINVAVAALDLPEGVTAAVNFGTYTAPAAGTADNVSGANGAYTFTVTLTHEDGATATTETLTMTITATAYVAPSRPSTSDSSGGSSTTTETTKNEDGSTTTAVTDHRTGTVTKTTEKVDGTVEVVETKKDGTVTKTVAEPDGTVIEAVTTPEGAMATTAKTPDGIVVKADSTAETEDVTVSIAVPTTILAAKVSIPVEINYSTVAVDAQGNIVNLSVPTEDLTSMEVRVEGSTELTLVKRGNNFVDIDGHWAEDSITFAAAHEFVNGTSETEFTPESEMTRGMMFTLLARMDGVDTTGGDTWYAKGSQWAVEERLSDGTNLESNITREQLATLLWRYAGRPEAKGELDFVDVDEVSDFAVNAMRWAVEQGIFVGTDSGELQPQGNATRAQAATVFLRFCRLMVK